MMRFAWSLPLLAGVLVACTQAPPSVLPTDVVWLRQFGARSEAAAVDLDAAGEVIVAGIVDGTMWPGLIEPGGGLDAFVSAWSPAGGGTPSWRWGYGGPGDELVTGLVVAPGSRIVVVGATNDRLVPQPFAPPATGGFNASLVDVSRAGDGIFYATHGGAGDDTAVAVTTSPDGAVWRLERYGPDPETGTYRGWPEGGLGRHQRSDDGGFHDTVWYAVGSSTGDLLHGLAVTPAGELVVVGGTTAATAGTEPPAGGLDAFVVLLALDEGTPAWMQVRWARRIATPAADVALGVAVDGEGRILVSGRTRGDLLGPATPNAGGNDVFVVRLDARDGEEGGRWQFGSDEDDVAHAAVVGADGDLYLVGATDGRLDPRSDPPGRNAFVARMRP